MIGQKILNGLAPFKIPAGRFSRRNRSLYSFQRAVEKPTSLRGHATLSLSQVKSGAILVTRPSFSAIATSLSNSTRCVRKNDRRSASDPDRGAAIAEHTTVNIARESTPATKFRMLPLIFQSLTAVIRADDPSRQRIGAGLVI